MIIKIPDACLETLFRAVPSIIRFFNVVVLSRYYNTYIFLSIRQCECNNNKKNKFSLEKYKVRIIIRIYYCHDRNITYELVDRLPFIFWVLIIIINNTFKMIYFYIFFVNYKKISIVINYYNNSIYNFITNPLFHQTDVKLFIKLQENITIKDIISCSVFIGRIA